MRLTAPNNYSGGTIVSAGRLLVSNAAGSATGSGAVNVEGGSLGGTGTIAGPVYVVPGGMLSPGALIGVLTINNSLTLSGTTIMELNAETRTNDLVRGLTSVAYAGALIVSNLSGTITSSNAFKLFNAGSYSGAFASLTPAIPGSGLGWNTNTLASDGTLRILSTTAPVMIPSAVSGGLLSFSWPADHIGWRLQVQTNSISIGLSTNWVDVPNAVLTNRVVVTIDPATGCAFYRLVYP